ncbi:hypothetical protein [Azospirillum rugosum]|uniref:Lipoprotein n=1 Tax=Azospirillum rugosum TaxID=416170 RepID=A0ABS4SU19_9PROT|nr:hypothetical protein [Azospirillum rugosum]MBP2295462.1 hypothetical protein [Azospirillum rugosum]MDQ0528341.1 hypothetical protein [Azospirillum rugosum]
MRPVPLAALAAAYVLTAPVLTACVQTTGTGTGTAAMGTAAVVTPAADAGSAVALRPPGTPARPAVALAPPQWRVGDTWQYSDGYGMRVTEVNGPAARFQRTDAPGQWYIARGPFREQLQSRNALRQVVFQSEDPQRLYTVPPGEPVVFRREYMRNGVLVRHRTSWTVEGTETITVPAGTFDAVILVMRTRSTTGNWTAYERWWYAPAVRNYVRMEFKYGEAPDNARVLTAYSLK